MRRRLSLVIAFIGVLGLVGFAPTADAAHDIKTKDGEHESSPRPPAPPTDLDGVCEVAGQVFIDNANGNGGVGSAELGDVNHNHYEFEEVSISCEPTSPDGLAFGPAAYAVAAAGGTDGNADSAPDMGTTTHGEDVTVGWSHQSCYDDEQPQGKDNCDFSNSKVDDLYDGTNENPPGSGKCSNCGEIEVREVAGARQSLSTENWVKFCRGDYLDSQAGGDAAGGTCSNLDNNAGGGFPVKALDGGDVIAWGVLKDWVGTGTTQDLCFLTELTFETLIDNMNGLKFRHALLEGAAVVWTTPDGDKSSCTGQKGKKTS